MTLEQALFQEERVVAVAETVIVQTDTSSGGSRPLGERARERLESWMKDESG